MEKQHEMRFFLTVEEWERSKALYKDSLSPLRRSGYFRKIFLEGLIKLESKNNG